MMAETGAPNVAENTGTLADALSLPRSNLPLVRPPSTTKPTDIPGWQAAFEAGLVATKALDGLRAQHADKLAAVQKVLEARETLVQKAKAGHAIEGGAAGKLARDHADATADADLAADAAKAAEIDMEVVQRRMRGVLLAELGRYRNRLRTEADVAGARASTAKHEAATREEWWHHIYTATVTPAELTIENITDLLGIRG